MKLLHTVTEVRQARWHRPAESWGVVPTMGFLHEGHFSLVRRARAENERVAVSIFVNPRQFGDAADLNEYPRNLEQDVASLTELGVDLVFAPSVNEMYPAGFQTTVTVSEATKRLEGAARPGHFAGVATIVCKLFNILQPTRAYFGQKDAQQTVVVRQMVQDLNLNLDIIICATIRELDGLALSSRNARLTESEREAATILFQTLNVAREQVEAGERDAELIRQGMRHLIERQPLARLDYVSIADSTSLTEIDEISGEILLSLAVFIGQVRLIDNFMLNAI